MFGGYFFYLPTQEVPPWGSSPRACHARIGVVDRTVDINGMRLHVKALGALGALSWCLSAQNRRSCQLGQLGKNQFLAWIKNFFLEYFGHFCFHKLGGGWGRQLERVLDSLWKHRKCPKTSQKVKDLHELPICAK